MKGHPMVLGWLSMVSGSSHSKVHAKVQIWVPSPDLLRLLDCHPHVSVKESSGILLVRPLLLFSRLHLVRYAEDNENYLPT